MVEKTAFRVWVVLPLAALAFHLGPGRQFSAADRAAAEQRRAAAAVERGDWKEAASRFEAARVALGDQSAERERLLLAEAAARVQAGELVEGQEQLQQLLAELEAADGSGADLTASVRHELATASYFAAWLMRVEGAAAEEWKPEAERARQQFRLLAEEGSPAEGGTALENLEATIRLEQMDLSDLLAKPLPKNCPQCRNLCQRKRKQCQSRSQSQEGEQQPQQQRDVRERVKQERGAGMNARQDFGS
jgi:hypothetical protein